MNLCLQRAKEMILELLAKKDAEVRIYFFHNNS